ncbi:t-SNARE [Scenedesmus sp. NREL 46B-D3]|nr:t-SNARE [Scenedesmus sp. NREL 46B-D3]
MAPATGNLSLRDRTGDFQAIAQRLQKQSVSQDAGVSSNHHQTKQTVQQQSEFARKASQIGLSIHTTSVRLQKLAQLAKRTSMFDDPSREIDEMTGIIKQDIQGLNMAIADLQRVSSKKPDENKQSQDHSHTVVNSLRTRLKDATQEFKDVLTMRTENLKVHKERRQLFSSQPDSAAALLERAPLLASSSSSSREQQLAGSSGSSSSARPSAAHLGGQLLQQQQQLAPQESSYQSSRAEALHNVEATIVELGSIFTQLAEMVAAQGEMTQRIDENVEETLGNVDNAKAQLMKYLNNISGNRWLMMKVFMVLMLFLVVFIVFIA